MLQSILKRAIVLSVSLFTVCSISFAQLPQTRLYSLLPTGGQIGQEFEVRVLTGADLDEVSELVFSHPKIQARQKTTESNGVKTPVANTFIVNIPADVPAGVYEARCGGLFGFSNPRRFAVDNYPVAADPADNNSPEKAAPLQLGQVVNGRLESGNDIDWFRISAKAGQRIVFDTWAERLDSKMNPVVTIYDSSGRRRLDWSRNSVGYDPVLAFNTPADGDYLIEIRDITYRNGNEYSYRLYAHTNPHIEFIWPPSGQAGTKAKFTLFGYNLPEGQKSEQIHKGIALEQQNIEIDIPAELDQLNVENRMHPVAAAVDAFSYRLVNDSFVSNPVTIGISPVPVTTEIEPNNTADHAQQLNVPVQVGGQFGQVADEDRYRFEAKTGEVYYVDVLAQRLGTNADPYLIVNQITKPAEGPEQVKRLTAQDDVGTNLLANVFETNTDDPLFRLKIPADGTYEVIVRDRYWESRGHPQLRYSLNIEAESPDFRVVAVPAAPTAGATWPTGLRQGDQFPVTVLAFRKHGYNGPITVSAENLPAGLSCPEIVIGPGETTSTLIVASSIDAPVGLHQLKLNAQAVIAEKEIQHPVRCGTVVWSSAANIPAISRVTDSFTISVIAEQAPFQVKSDAHRFTVNQGRQLLIPLELEKRNGFDAKITLTTQGLPKNSNIDYPNSALEKGEQAKTLRMFIKENSPPGLYTIWMKTQGQVSYSRNPAKVERLQKSLDEAKTKADAAKKAEQEATKNKTTTANALTEATKKLQETQNQLKTAVAEIQSSQGNLEQLKKLSAEATAKLNGLKKQSAEAMTLAKTQAEKLKTLEAELKTKEQSIAVSQTEIEKADANIKETEKQIANLTQSAAEQPENEELKAQLATATETLQKFQTEKKTQLEKVEEVKANIAQSNKSLDSLKTSLQETNQKLASTEKQLQESSKTATDAENKMLEAIKQLQAAEAKQKELQKVVTQMQQAVKTAETAKTTAEAAEKTAQAASKSAEAARAAVEKEYKAAQTAAKPKNINFTPPTTPVVIEVKPAPVKLSASVPNGGKVKKGESLELTVKITRQNDFAGPVQLALATPPGLNGLTADPVEVPTDQSEGKITVKTTEDAPDGKIPNLVIRAASEFNGQAEVDAPINLEVTK